jgi:putative transposase
MVAFIDDHKAVYGVEPICAVLPIAPSTYYWHKAREADPSRRSARVQRDERLRPEVRRVWDQNFQVYGVEKVWTQLNREGVQVARCTVARLMADLGLRGAVRGRSFKVTTHAADGVERPLDLVDRDFAAARPNELWVSDLTYVRVGRTFAYVAFVIDAFARRIVGWQISSSLKSDLALDALDQAVDERLGNEGERLVHHSDRGSQGGFKEWSQHHELEVLRWARRGGVQIERYDRRCVRRVVRRRPGENIVRSSGRRSPEVTRPSRRLWRRACPRRWERDGFATVEAWHRTSFTHYRAGTCRSWNEKRSPFCGPRVMAFGRSRVIWGARRRRFRGSYGATQPREAATSSIVQRRLSGTRTRERCDRRSPSSRPTRS